MPDDNLLQQAVRQGDSEAVRRLVASGVDINRCDPQLETALLVAIEADAPEMVTLLLELGADPNRAGACGESPLHRAVDVAVEAAKDAFDRHAEDRPASTAIIKLLVASGADPQRKNSNGRSPIDWARKIGFSEGTALLDALMRPTHSRV